VTGTGCRLGLPKHLNIETCVFKTGQRYCLLVVIVRVAPMDVAAVKQKFLAIFVQLDQEKSKRSLAVYV
jgi:hypothetical protein